MKTFVLALVALLVGVTASPNRTPYAYKQKWERGLISDAVSDAVEELSQTIKDLGLDPWNLETYDYEYALPVSPLLDLQVHANDVLFNGLSDIVVNSASYAILTSRLRFDISIPRTTLSVGDAGLDLTILGKDFETDIKGSVSIIHPRLTGNVRVYIGIISGVSIRSLSLAFTLQAVESNVSWSIQGVDVSDAINTFLSVTIPELIEEQSSNINELLNVVGWNVINEML